MSNMFMTTVEVKISFLFFFSLFRSMITDGQYISSYLSVVVLISRAF